ncbi:retrotransposon protein, putative, ty1-copia subclass [Tanacetum coccineum]
MTTSSANNSVFRGFFEKQKLTGPNFIDWYRQLRIVLSIEDKLNYLEQPLPPAPVAPKGKGKNKLAYAPKPKIPLPPKREDPAKDSICHECGEIGHWKRNCPQYLAEMLKKKKNTASGASGSCIFTIELNTFLNRSWIYDTGCGTHICNTMQGLRASRKLKLGALSLYMGNGQRKVVEAIGVFYLCLPSGLVIALNNCHYAPFITRGVISVLRLYEDGFVNCFVNNTIQVSRNNMVYFSAILRDGIFEIDLSNSYANDSSIYAISNKRAKLDLDSALLWHCRLGHISKKRIEKLQHEGLLNSTDLRAFEKCISCMSGKMARKPYTHQVKMAKDLLGLIHTDGCEALVKRDTLTKPDKLEPRSIKCIFIGYPKEKMGYSFYYPPKNKVLVARNAEFLENSLITQEASGSLEDLEIIQEEDTHPSIDTSLHHEEDDLEIDEPQSDIVPIRRSTRIRHTPDYMCLYIDAEEHELGDLGKPANYKAALLDPESDKWLNAMNVEMQSMKDNKV